MEWQSLPLECAELIGKKHSWLHGPSAGPSSCSELPPDSWDHRCGWDPASAWVLGSHILFSQSEQATESRSVRKGYRS